MSARKKTQTPNSGGSGTRKSEGFSEEERFAMKERARELKAERSGGGKTDAEGEVLARIAEMADGDRAMAERVHAIVKAAAPQLTSRLWYGMPAYAKDGNVLCFFQAGQKFKTRYSSFGFSDKAKLDDGNMWPTGFALKRLTAADEERIADLVRKAIG
jgi:uncharacterized protein YdhG (YjbR/CyaY superfamily)